MTHKQTSKPTDKVTTSLLELLVAAKNLRSKEIGIKEIEYKNIKNNEVKKETIKKQRKIK